MGGCQTGVPGAIEEGRYVTIQLVCQPLASGSDPLAELVSEQSAGSLLWVYNPGSKPSGVVGAVTLQYQPVT